MNIVRERNKGSYFCKTLHQLLNKTDNMCIINTKKKSNKRKKKQFCQLTTQRNEPGHAVISHGDHIYFGLE